jgi:hypothetical protein
LSSSLQGERGVAGLQQQLQPHPEEHFSCLRSAAGCWTGSRIIIRLFGAMCESCLNPIIIDLASSSNQTPQIFIFFSFSAFLDHHLIHAQQHFRIPPLSLCGHFHFFKRLLALETTSSSSSSFVFF